MMNNLIAVTQNLPKMAAEKNKAPHSEESATGRLRLFEKIEAKNRNITIITN